MNAEDRSKGIEPLEVLQLCKDFLGRKWSQVTEDNFDFKVLTQGFGNRLFVCGVKDDTADVVEPKQVLVRYYGGNILPLDIPNRIPTEAGEVLTFYCLGKAGIGPNLYGVFKGGRIEQFIPSTSFTMDQFCGDKDVSEAIARVLARFHTAEVPLKKSPQDPVKILRRYVSEYLSTKGEIPALCPTSEEEIEEIEELSAFDDSCHEEIDWIAKIVPLIESRTVFCHNDVNRSNMIVRLEDGSNQSLDQRLVLIDYELNGYNYRGFDIASHFIMRVLDFGNHEPYTGRPYPSKEIRRHFVATYLDECKKLPVFSQDWNQNGADSLEHVLLESSFFCLVHLLTMHVFTTKNRALFAKMTEGKGDKKGKGFGGPAAFLRFFKQRKVEFLETYPQYA